MTSMGARGLHPRESVLKSPRSAADASVMRLFAGRRESIPQAPSAREHQRRIARATWVIGTLGTLGIGLLAALATGSLGP